MKKQYKILLMFLIGAVLFTSLLHAEERDREGAFAGVFIKRAERPIGEREYLALVVKPFEGDDNVTVFVPRKDDFMQAVRRLREGDKVEIGFVTEEGQKWLKRIKIERRREEKEPPREEEAHRRELSIHQRELQEHARNLKRELRGLRDDQDQEAREIQAQLKEINQQLKNIERQLKGPKRKEPGTEEKEIRVVLGHKGEHPEMAAEMEKLHARIDELKEAAALAAREGRHDKAEQFLRKAKILAEQIEVQAREMEEIGARHLKEQIARLKDMARQAKQQGRMEEAENLWNHAQELERTLKREFQQPKIKKPRPEGIPELLSPPSPPPPPLHKAPAIEELLNSFRAQLKEALEHRLQQAGKQLKEALAERFRQVTGGFHELSMRIERLEKELHELRAENERLRRELYERRRPLRDLDREVRERREIEERRRVRPEELRDRRGERYERSRDRTGRREAGERERPRAEREERRLLRDRTERREAGEHERARAEREERSLLRDRYERRRERRDRQVAEPRESDREEWADDNDDEGDDEDADDGNDEDDD